MLIVRVFCLHRDNTSTRPMHGVMWTEVSGHVTGTVYLILFRPGGPMDVSRKIHVVYS
jgi:hypothetical protein